VTGASLIAITAAAATVGALHSVAPDHWVPFAALARARRWPLAHTARITILCGLGHVTVSAILGIVALVTGLKAVHAIGIRLEEHATLLLMAFGTAYMVWGLWRSFRRDPLAVMHHRRHHHAHGHNDHDHGLTEWSLFTLFSLDPCVAVIPMIVAASAGGWGAVGAVVVVYEAATIAAMMVLVGAAVAGARTMRFAFLDRFGDAVAGGLILTTGGVLAVLGL
jgi:nickel/cobalt transporter (NicO) family protein